MLHMIGQVIKGTLHALPCVLYVCTCTYRACMCCAVQYMCAHGKRFVLNMLNVYLSPAWFAWFAWFAPQAVQGDLFANLQPFAPDEAQMLVG
jgi:hypothetical protein